MALIKFNSATGKAQDFAGFDSSNTNTFSHTTAGTNRVLIVISALVTPGAAYSGVTATYGGVSMTLHGVASTNGTFASSHRFATFSLLNPASGANNVVVTWSGLEATFPSKITSTGAVSYQNVRAVEGFIKTADNPSSSTTQSVTGTSTGCGDVMVFGHMRGEATAFASYNQTQRYTVASTDGIAYARILLGDNGSGDVGSVTSTTTTTSSINDWAASGLRLKREAANEFFAIM